MQKIRVYFKMEKKLFLMIRENEKKYLKIVAKKNEKKKFIFRRFFMSFLFMLIENLFLT